MAVLGYAIVTRAVVCAVYRFTANIIWFYMCVFRFIANY